jgi:hypothetical protein
VVSKSRSILTLEKKGQTPSSAAKENLSVENDPAAIFTVSYT